MCLARLAGGTLVVALLALLASAAPEEPDFSAELPRIAPVEPDAALATFRLAPGYKIEQVAAEPLVHSPVAMAWDENGRLYVCEMRGYSEDRDQALSRIRLLVDTDADGRYDQSTIFVDGLLWPTAVACWKGGVFIGDAPDILYCKDTTGDGVADERRRVFTGFGFSNVQGLLNSFNWTLDNRLEGTASSSGGEIVPADNPQARPVNVRGRDFAIDPRTMTLVPTSGGAQHGLTFDDWGHKFACSNSDHIQQVMFEDRYLARNPFFTPPGARVSIAADGPQAEVFRASPVEPWRIVRTRLRVSGQAPGPVEGGGRPAGYFTGATGTTIVRGTALGDAMHGMAVVADIGSNLVHRKRLTLEGVRYTAHRVDDKSEFLTSTDIWFRPAQFYNGPDGALYIADVYREVIEHPASLPPAIKKHLDLTAGRDRGRIYRIVADGFKQPPLPRLGSASDAELVALLAHPNAWHRETASRLLYERQAAAAIAPLEKLAIDGPAPLGRLHALYALRGLGGPEVRVLQHALHDPDPRVRAHAVRLTEPWLDRVVVLAEEVAALDDDPDMQVRYQLAFTAGELPGDLQSRTLLALARRDAGDAWMRTAILNAAQRRAACFALWIDDEALRRSEGGRALLAALTTQIGMAHQAAEVREVFARAQRLSGDDQPLAGTLVRALATGLARGGKSLADVLTADDLAMARRTIEALLATARTHAVDAHRSPRQRADAIDTLGLDAFAEVRSILEGCLDNRQPAEVQAAALRTLDRFADPGVAPLLITAWPGMSPALRSAASEALFARRDRLLALLDAIERRELLPESLESARVQLLLAHKDPAIRSRAERLLASVRLGRRADVVATYRDVLTLPGDAARGKIAFQKTCAACHRVENVGHEIGPNLATIKARGAEFILLNVLDPSREVNPQYVNYVCITDDGRSITGMLAAETATSVTLRRAEGASDTVLRANIDELRSTGLSIMPEGLEKQLDKQTLADIIAYLMGAK